jgi:hypothetical protein
VEKRKKRTVTPTPTRTKTSLKKKKSCFFQIFFVEITIKVKQGQKQLISLNEQRYFAREIGKTKSIDSIDLVLYMREEGNKKGIRLLFYSFFIT